MRLIDADRLLNILNDNQAIYDNELKGTYYDGVGNGLEAAITCVEYAPTIEERKHGHWIYDDPFGALPKCSECGCRSRDAAAEECSTTYCPHCGAAMDEEVQQP